MQFRPCIDIHNGKVKQIVGSSLQDEGDLANENFVALQGAAFYAELYKKNHLPGGHVILLNPQDSPYFEATKNQAMEALRTYPGGLQVGGGITAGNAVQYLEAGASHVIVSSYVFKGGKILEHRLNDLVQKIGKEHLVLDLSCRRQDDTYYIVTDRWQTMTEIQVNEQTLDELSKYCDEFLIHAVDVEGKNSGIEIPLVDRISSWNQKPITYAGGVHNMEDIQILREKGRDRIHVTIGTALDIFGGNLAFDEIVRMLQKN